MERLKRCTKRTLRVCAFAALIGEFAKAKFALKKARVSYAETRAIKLSHQGKD